jgi:hypothetical protein
MILSREDIAFPLARANMLSASLALTISISSRLPYE